MAQVEALRKHRNGGKQTVIVQQVNVADGGQAIVGIVQTGAGGVNNGQGSRKLLRPDKNILSTKTQGDITDLLKCQKIYA